MAAMLARLDAENRQLKAQLEQSGATIQQQSELAEQKIQEELLEPPVFDYKNFEFMSDDDKEKYQKEFSQKMSEYAYKVALRDMQKEIAPIKEQFQKAKETEMIANVKAKLSSLPEYVGFSEMMPQIETIIAKEPALQSTEPEKRYTIAYLMAKGLNAVQTPKRSDEDIINEVMSNPEILKQIKAREAQMIEKSNANLPKFAATHGTVPATPTQKPKTLEEAQRNALKILGLR